MEKVINCRFIEDNFFITRSYETTKAICIDTNDIELVQEIKDILTRRASSILSKHLTAGENIDYPKLTDLCKTIEQIDESIKQFEEFKEEQEDESCTVTN